MEKDHENIVEKQIELTLIPSPTYHEEKKAARLLEMFQEEGLTDCHIDEYGNCVGIRKGTGGGKTVLVEAHMDTVFNLDTRHKYLCRVVTSSSGGSFRMLGNSCCSHSDTLRSINGTAPTV